MSPSDDGRRKVLSRGTVLVDPKAAVAKLREYQLTEPGDYVLELVRVGVLSGATSLHLENDADDLALGFDGEPVPAELLSRVLEHLFSATDRRLRLLAIAVNTALGTKPAYLDLYTTEGAAEGTVSRVRWTPRDPDDTEGLDATAVVQVPRPKSMPERGMKVHLHEAFRLGVMAEWFARDPAETTLLRARTSRLAVPLLRDGVAVKGTDPLAGALVSSTLRGLPEGVSGTLALVRHDDDSASTVEFYELGVRLESRGLRGDDDARLPLRAWIDARELPTNVSRSKVDLSGELGRSLDRAWPAALAAVVSEAVKAIAPDDSHATAPREALCFLVQRGLDDWWSAAAALGLGSAPSDDPPAFGRCSPAALREALGAPLIPLATGAYTTPTAVAFREGPRYVWRGRKPLAGDLAPWLGEVLWEPPGSLGLAALIACVERRDASDAISQAREAHARYTRFRASAPRRVRGPSALDDVVLRARFAGPDITVAEGDLSVVRVETPGAEGELVLCVGELERAGQLHLATYVENRPLSAEAVDTAAVTVRVAMQLPGLRPTPAFDGVSRNTGFDEAVRLARRVLVRSVCLSAREWTTPSRRPSPRTQRAMVRAAWVEAAALREVTELLRDAPELLNFPAWEATEAGRHISMGELRAMASERTRAVLVAPRSRSGRRADGRPVLRAPDTKEREAITMALPPDARWIDVGETLGRKGASDPSDAIGQGAWVGQVPWLSEEGEGWRLSISPALEDKSTLTLAFAGEVLETRNRTTCIAPTVIVLDDDYLLPDPKQGALPESLAFDRGMAFDRAEAELLRVLCLALQGDRPAMSRLRGPLSVPAVDRFLMTSLARLRRPEGIERLRTAKVDTEALRAALANTPLVPWFGANGELRRLSPGSLEARMSGAASRVLRYVESAPVDLAGEGFEAVVVPDRGERSRIEAALDAKLEYAGQEVPKLQLQRKRRLAQESLARRPTTVLRELASLQGVGPLCEVGDPARGVLFAKRASDVRGWKIEVLHPVPGRSDTHVVLFAVTGAVGDGLRVPLVGRCVLEATEGLTPELEAVTGKGRQWLGELADAMAPRLIDAMLEAMPSGEATGASGRALVSCWARASGRKAIESSDRRRALAAAVMWRTPFGETTSIDRATGRTKNVLYVLLDEDERWISAAKGEAADPLVIAVPTAEDARALGLIGAVTASDQSAPMSRTQRARRLLRRGAERVRIDERPSDPRLVGRIEALCAGLGVGEIRLEKGSPGLRITLFEEHGPTAEVLRECPINLVAALASPDLDADSLRAKKESVDVTGRLVEAGRKLIEAVAVTPEGTPPWALGALRWHLLSGFPVAKELRSYGVFESSAGEFVSLDALDAQVRDFKSVLFSTERPDAPLNPRNPLRKVVLLSTEESRWLAQRRRSEDYTSGLKDDLMAQRWARSPPASRIVVPDTARPIVGPCVEFDGRGKLPEGEVWLLGGSAPVAAEVYWYVTRRKLGTTQCSNVLWPAVVAGEFPAMNPDPRRSGPSRDAVFERAEGSIAAMIEEAIRVHLRPRSDALAEVTVHRDDAPTWSAGTHRAVGWLWLDPDGDTGEITVRLPMRTEVIMATVTDPRSHDWRDRGAKFYGVPVGGTFFLRGSDRDARSDAESVARDLVRWAWPKLLERWIEKDKTGVLGCSAAVRMQLLVRAALAGQLTGSGLKSVARGTTLPGSTVTLSVLQTLAREHEALAVVATLDARPDETHRIVPCDERWYAMLDIAGMLREPSAPPAPVVIKEPFVWPSPIEEAPAPPVTFTPPTPRESVPAPVAKATQPPRVDEARAWKPGASVLALLHEVGLERSVLRAVEGDRSPAGMGSPVVYYDSVTRVATVATGHPVVVSLEQGDGARATRVLALAVLGEVNRRTGELSDAQEEQCLDALLERVAGR